MLCSSSTQRCPNALMAQPDKKHWAPQELRMHTDVAQIPGYVGEQTRHQQSPASRLDRAGLCSYSGHPSASRPTT